MHDLNPSTGDTEPPSSDTSLDGILSLGKDPQPHVSWSLEKRLADMKMRSGDLSAVRLGISSLGS